MFLLDDIGFFQTQYLPLDRMWLFLPFGYILTILIETPILLIGLSPKLSFKQKLACGVWLTACTYPIVVLVLPALMQDFSRFTYLLVAESFAHFGECVIFWIAFRGKNLLDSGSWVRCFAAILVANFASFSFGELMNYYQWFGYFQ
jgi:hypothetical protein